MPLLFCLLVVLLLPALGNAQQAGVYTFASPTRIVDNQANATVKAAAPQNIYTVSANSACYQVLLVYTEDPATTTGCLTYANGTSLPCRPEFRGTTHMNCFSVGCFLFNPVQKYVVFVDYLANIKQVFGNGTFITPTQMAVAGTNNYYHVFVYDSATNNVTVYFVVSGTPSALTSEVLTIGGTETIAQIAAYQIYSGSSGCSFVVLWANGTGSIYSVPFYGNSFSKPTVLGFTINTAPLGLFAIDLYNRYYLYEPACSCVQVVSETNGALLAVMNLTTTPQAITFSQNKVFVIDEDGVLEFSFELVISSLVTTNNTCSTVGGSVSVMTVGGAAPLSFLVLPDEATKALSATVNFTNTYTFTGLKSLAPATTPLDLFSETLTEVLRVFDTTYSVVNSSVIQPHSGEHSMEISLPGYPNYIEFDCNTWDNTCFDCTKYQYVSFWINVGLGGQALDLYFSGNSLHPPWTAPAGSLVTGAWHNVVLDISELLGSGSTSMTFMVSNSNPNPFYVDDWQLLPYTIPSRSFVATDACGQMLTKPFSIGEQIFSASVVSTPTTCNADGINADKAFNGQAEAVLQYGVAPFRYNWAYLGYNGTTSVATGLGSSQSYVTIFDNAVVAPWRDASTAPSANLQDSTMYVSAPYGFSFTPSIQYSTIAFVTTDTYSTTNYIGLEFWVNGGPVGLQRLDVFVEYYLEDVASSALEDIFGVPLIPANTWMKGFLKFPGTENFNLIGFEADGGENQTTIYFDDLRLLSKPILTVTDSTGCVVTVPELAISSPTALVGAVSVSNAQCYNSNDGSVVAIVAGGVGPYTYTWSQGGSGNAISGLGTSNVTVDVTDANTCKLSPLQASVLQPPPMTLTVQHQSIQCNGGQGQLTAFVQGGSAPYTYSWTSNSTTADKIPQPNPQPLFTDAPAQFFSAVNADVRCLGAPQGSGVAPTHSGYCSLWPQFSSISSNASLVGCAECLESYAGIDFWIYIENAADISSLSIGLPPSSLFPLHEIATNLSAGQWNNVFLNFSLAGATQPQALMIASSNPTSMGTIILDDIVAVPAIASSVGIAVFSGFHSVVFVTAATHILTIVDANGCQYSQAIEVQEPDALNITYFAFTPSSTGATDGSIQVNATGGTQPYTYSWVNYTSTNNELDGVGQGVYIVQVTDAHGCIFESQIPLTYNATRTLRKFDSRRSGGLAAVIGVGTCIAVFGIIMLAWNWAAYAKLGAFFSLLIMTGIIMGFASAAVLLPKPTDALCTLFPWLLGVGFILVYGCLFLKTWVLYRVWLNAQQYKKAKITPSYILRVVGSALLVEVVFLAIWTAIDPPRVRLTNVENNGEEWECNTKHPTFWIIFAVVKGLWLLFGALLSVLTRHIVREHNENVGIAYAIYSNVLVLVIAIPLAVLIDQIPGGRVIVEVIVIVTAFTLTTILMFASIWQRVLTHRTNVEKTSGGGNNSKSTTRAQHSSHESATNTQKYNSSS